MNTIGLGSMIRSGLPWNLHYLSLQALNTRPWAGRSSVPSAILPPIVGAGALCCVPSGAAHGKREERLEHCLEADYLLFVDDETRQGALRFAEQEGGPFLAVGGPSRIPPLVELPKLLRASERVASDRDSDQDLRLLLAPGSSLGGARPKASVRDRDGRLAIAKFPHRGDDVDVELWESVALALASRAGIAVSDWRIEEVAGRSVLLLRRFDREAGCRVPFLSAMSMLGTADNELHSYLEIVDAIRRYGAEPDLDMRGLWRRVVFNVLVSNTDDADGEQPAGITHNLPGVRPAWSVSKTTADDAASSAAHRVAEQKVV